MTQASPASTSANADNPAAVSEPPQRVEDQGPPPLPIDWISPQFTLRAVITGMILGAVLSTCNVYAGLKIGWGTNMSITGALLSYGIWMGLRTASFRRVRGLAILETNTAQTASSAAGAVSSAGLVAPIPALAMLTGQTLTWHYLALWVFVVCLVGITVGVALRRQMLIVDALPFPGGLATAEMLREIYARGTEAIRRVFAMGGAAVLAGVITVLKDSSVRVIGAAVFPFSVRGFSLKSLTFDLDPNLLLIGVGGLIGMRACISLLGGAILAWGVLAPQLIHSQHLRLGINEHLAALPAGVTWPEEKPPRIKYNQNRARLEWVGVMSAAQLESLLALSDEPDFQEALRKLHLRSQLEVSIPLESLPSEVKLAGTPVSYDPERRVLVAKAGLSAQAHADLAARSTDPAYLAALRELYDRFGYTTTRAVQFSERLETYPQTLVIPGMFEYALHYDKKRGALVARGLIPDELFSTLNRRADELAGANPLDAAALAKFKGALAKLRVRAAADALPEGVAFSGVLGERVRYDPSRNELQVRGVLGAAEEKALQALSKDPDFQETIATIIAGARYQPVVPNTTNLVEWLLWPGVTLMVVSSLTAFAFSWKSILRSFTGSAAASDSRTTAVDTGELATRWFVVALLVSLVLSVALQISFFQIVWWAAVLGVLLSFLLAIVAARVSGETNVTPVGAMGKVTQLVFGALTPNPAANLMAANVTGGAASQCADLLHDLKTGHLLGAIPRLQFFTQILGAFAGSLAGSAVYLILIPNPAEQLLTEQWPAPAVAAWKAVAELFMVGLDAMPPGAPLAMIIAGVLGVLLPVLEQVLPKRHRLWIPSAASLGLAFVIPARNSISMFLGALLVFLSSKFFPKWSKRFVVTIASGLIAGESLTGVGLATWALAKG